MNSVLLFLGGSLAFVGALALTSWLYDFLVGVISRRKRFHYVPRDSFFTRDEHEFYISLLHAAAHEYRIFARVHVSDIVSPKTVAQDPNAARAHLDRKMVDFLISDKHALTPLLAINLEGTVNEEMEKAGGAHEVRRILAEAHIPLLTFPNNGSFDPNKIIVQIRRALGE